MPLELVDIGVGSSGGRSSGLSVGLGPEQNTFTNTAERDTYTTANPTWVAQYNTNRNFLILGDGNLQRRNVAGTAWKALSRARISIRRSALG